MKKILFAAALIFSAALSAQTDSSFMNSGKLSLRMNDWEYLTNIISFNQSFENLYDSIKIKVRPLSNANYPSNTTIVSVDSVDNNSLLTLALLLKNQYNKTTSTTIDRISSAIRNIGSHWINSKLDSYEAEDAANFIMLKNEGKRRLRKQ